MKGFWAIATLAFGGVILADILANPAGVTAGGGQLNNILNTTFSAMLGK
jgi:hypothetical protein